MLSASTQVKERDVMRDCYLEYLLVLLVYVLADKLGELKQLLEPMNRVGDMVGDRDGVLIEDNDGADEVTMPLINQQ